MAREFVQQSFYDHSPYVNCYYAAQIPIEYFIADVLMRHDLSRVIWASDAYSFRRRFELTDAAAGEYATAAPSSLNLPFANYWYADGAWAPDDRPFSVQPSQILNGVWYEGLPAYLKALAVKTTFTATAFFSRDDDARLAQELLLWEHQPKGPIFLATSVDWKGITIRIPVYLTLDPPLFNPQAINETEWLKSHKVYPIKFSFTARSYIISYPRQKLLSDVTSTDTTPPFMRLVTEDSEDPITISEHVILEFAVAKNLGDVTGEGSINPQTTDIVDGYFQPSEALLESCEVVDGSITSSSFGLSWTFTEEALASFEMLKILVPGQDPIYIEDSAITTQTISGLSPSSEYDITLLFYTASGEITTYKFSVATLADADNSTGVPITKKKGKLQGMVW